MRTATFRRVAFPNGRLWQENPDYDEPQFSPLVMNVTSLPYVGTLREWSPEFPSGHTSALTLLALRQLRTALHCLRRHLAGSGMSCAES